MVNFNPMYEDNDDNLTKLIQKKAYIMFVTNLIIRTKEKYSKRRTLKFGETGHYIFTQRDVKIHIYASILSSGSGFQNIIMYIYLNETKVPDNQTKQLLTTI